MIPTPPPLSLSPSLPSSLSLSFFLLVHTKRKGVTVELVWSAWEHFHENKAQNGFLQEASLSQYLGTDYFDNEASRCSVLPLEYMCSCVCVHKCICVPAFSRFSEHFYFVSRMRVKVFIAPTNHTEVFQRKFFFYCTLQDLTLFLNLIWKNK